MNQAWHAHLPNCYLSCQCDIDWSIPVIYYWSKEKNNWNHPATSFHHVNSSRWHPRHNKSKTWLHHEKTCCYTQILQQSDHSLTSTENTPIVFNSTSARTFTSTKKLRPPDICFVTCLIHNVHQIRSQFWVSTSQSAILPARVQFQNFTIEPKLKKNWNHCATPFHTCFTTSRLLHNNKDHDLIIYAMQRHVIYVACTFRFYRNQTTQCLLKILQLDVQLIDNFC